MADDYIHSFTAQEQQRLIDQALFLEPYHHTGLDLRGCRRVLEVGCGVGAQMSVLLRRWPEAHITGVDRSESQLDRARQTLSAAITQNRAELHLAPGDRLSFADNAFDAVCVFWVFEHVSAPMPIMSEIRRVLRPGGPFYATEVFDKGLYMYPSGAATAAYFREFTALQAEFGGDPDIGVRMAGLLAQAGFVDVTTTDVSPTLDARMTDAAPRAAFLDYFQTLLLSGAEALLSRGRIAADTVSQVKAEFAALMGNRASVFTYGAKQVCGRKPRT